LRLKPGRKYCTIKVDCFKHIYPRKEAKLVVFRSVYRTKSAGSTRTLSTASKRSAKPSQPLSTNEKSHLQSSAQTQLLHHQRSTESSLSWDTRCFRFSLHLLFALPIRLAATTSRRIITTTPVHPLLPAKCSNSVQGKNFPSHSVIGKRCKGNASRIRLG
jgi:hypothetical protein